MKRLWILCGLILAGQVQGQVWEKSIVPGLTYRMEVDRNIPRIVHAVRFSFGAPGLKLKSELAGGTVIEENATKGRETISEMAARTDSLVAINADFFPFTGDPLGLMVKDGQVVSASNNRAVFGWGDQFAEMGLIDFDAKMVVDGQEIPLKGINQECPLNDIVLNTEVGSIAVAKLPNVHAVFKMDTNEWTPNGEWSGTFVSMYADADKMPIQPGNAVVTANGTKAELLKSLIPGQRATFSFRAVGFDWARVNQAVGGGPFLVRKGIVSVDATREKFNKDFAEKRHPRSAVGLTKVGDLWFVVIDGRQKMSDGATLEETAKVMLDLGCTEAMNLDGGGSSALNILGLTVNRPSEGKERPVANGVVLLGPKPEPNRTGLKISGPAVLNLGMGKTLHVVDENGNEVPNSDVVWSASGDAWIDQGGLVRPFEKGKVEVAAMVRGQVLRTTFVIEDALPPAKPRTPAITSRSKKGRGG
jgi:uncharacterized protein YigE (DUF2233 family)